MIQILNKEIEKFISLISIPNIPPVKLYIVPDFDSVETDDGQTAFACYIEGDKIIVPDGLTEEDKELVFSHIAHEYYHHIEYCLGVAHDENEAEAFAEKMTELWREYSSYQNRFSVLFPSKAEDHYEDE